MTSSFRDELLNAWETFTAALPAARLERGPGYVVVAYPPFPSAAMNAVWSWGGGAAAVAELASRLAEIEASGVSPGVVVFDGEASELEREARTLGLTERHEIPGMVATASTFQPAGSVELDVVVAPSGSSASRHWMWLLRALGFRASGLRSSTPPSCSPSELASISDSLPAVR